MALNEEYLRLNLYKKPADTIRNLEVQTEKFAYDLHYNVFTRGEVTDYEAISVSITNILLTSFNEILFKNNLGSSTSFILFGNASNTEYSETLVDRIIAEILLYETRIQIVESNVMVNINRDTHTLDIEIPYVIKQSGLTSLYKKRISV
jgi:phage baseplate assembly protein W|tara:strand:+ start:159 stop:605 length:447 start_codon:yes stop_codon:yes gene_type:complete